MFYLHIFSVTYIMVIYLCIKQKTNNERAVDTDHFMHYRNSILYLSNGRV